MAKKEEKQGNNLTESFVSITLGFLIVIIAGLLVYNYFSKNKQQKEAEKKAQDTWEEQSLNLPATHTVVANESLWVISEKYYGTGYNWVKIAEENNLANPDGIEVGMTLNIPVAEITKPKEEELVSSTSSEKQEQAKTYTVVKGDSLWKIAVQIYGDGYAWTKIAQANNLSNPDIIHAGNVLTLPN